jgi:regulator of sigma E protease
MVAFIINVALILFVLGLLITLHELGHFLAAKWSKVQVDEFAIGMGPAIFQKEYKGTFYTLRVLPIGGYVKILGDGDDFEEGKKIEKDNPHNFQNIHILKKILILSAGVLMNLMTAVIIYYGFLFVSDFKAPAPGIENFTPWFGTEQTQIEGDIQYKVAEEGNASESEMPEEGFIVSVGYPGESADEMDEVILSSEVSTFISANTDTEVQFGICEDTSNEETCGLYTVKVSEEGKVGIYLPLNYIDLIVYEGMEKVFGGFVHSANVVQMGVVYIGQTFSSASESGDYSEAANTVASPIGLYFIVDLIRSYGLLGILDLIANLSLTLFIMNLLPIPALDGGRIVLVSLEEIMGDKYNKTVEAWAIRISFLALMLFMVAIIVKDIFYLDNFKELLG